jgi:soluble lytic murein transglycosylase-like protein
MTMHYRNWAMAILLVIICPSAFPAEIAFLHNGFTIRHEHRQALGQNTRLFLSKDSSSFVDIPTASIERYEHDDAPPSAPSAPSTPFLTTSRTVRPPSTQASLNEVISAASGRYKLDPDLVNSVIRAESGFNTRAVSHKGARGLMQLMPETAATLGVNDGFDPQQNVDGGTRYLRELLERYNFDLLKALAAYNAGPARVEQFRGVPPYQETQAYVRRIVKDFNRKKTAQQRSASKQKPARQAIVGATP